jgi:hypothetical protein
MLDNSAMPTKLFLASPPKGRKDSKMNTTKTNRVTIYFADKLAGKTGMGGGLDINGNVATRGGVVSIHPVFAQLAMARAKAKHPDWQVEMVTSTADAAFFDTPTKQAIEKATRELELFAN